MARTGSRAAAAAATASTAGEASTTARPTTARKGPVPPAKIVKTRKHHTIPVPTRIKPKPLKPLNPEATPAQKKKRKQQDRKQVISKYYVLLYIFKIILILQRTKGKARREILFYHKHADELLIRKAPFTRLVREYLYNTNPDARIGKRAVEILQQITEAWIVDIFARISISLFYLPFFFR